MEPMAAVQFARCLTLLRLLLLRAKGGLSISLQGTMLPEFVLLIFTSQLAAAAACILGSPVPTLFHW
jgi:hypothetical protein